MDMELFFKNLGIEPDNSQTPQISTQAIDKAQIIPYNGNELVNQGMYSNGETDSDDDDSKDHFDVAFIVGEVGYDKSQLEGICSEIKAISEIIFERSNDVTISIYGLDGSGNTQSKWYGRADNIENVEVMLGKIEPKEVQNENGMVVVSECVDYVTLAHKNTESEERRNRAEYCFMFFDPLYQIEDGYNVFQYLAQSPRTDEYGMKLLEAISKDGTDIDFSTVTSCYSTIEEMTSSYAKQVSLKTNGINIEDISPESIVNESIEHIYSTAPDDDRLYEILIGTSYTVVNLKKPITEKYIENAIKYGHSYIDISEFDEEDIEDCADTDGDGLWDFQEIKVFKGSTETPENQIIRFEDGKLMLPTVNDMTKEVYKDIYSSEEIDAFREYFAEQYGQNVGSEFWNTPILPINSHPTELDGDGDGIPDKLDSRTLTYDNLPDLFKYYINEGYMQHCDVVAVYNNSYVCNNVSISALKYLPKECEIPDVTGFKTVSIYSLQYKNKCIYGVSKNNITQLSGSLLFVLYASIELMDYYKVKENNQVFNVSGRGITFCASFTGMNYTGSINYIFDNNGNNQIQLSSGGGISTGTGVSITKNFIIATVDDMENMDGLGFNVGGSIGKMVAAGGDLLFMPIDVNEDGDFSDDEDKWHWGISCSAGFGGGVEGHVNGSYANSILSWNNYDLVEEVLKHIINEVVS